MKKETNVSAVILAGGENKRFNGKTKANIQISGIRIITRTIKILHEIFDEIIIVTNTPEEFKSFHQYNMVSDIYKNAGPLGGIHAALTVAKNDAVFVVASDMPCLSGELIRKQLEYFNLANKNVLIPKIGDYIEPLHGIYSKKIHVKLDDYLRKSHQYALRNFFPFVKLGYFALDDNEENRRSFININTPHDLEEVEHLVETVY